MVSQDLDLVSTSLAARLDIPIKARPPEDPNALIRFTSSSRSMSGVVEGAPITITMQLIRPHRNEHVLDLSGGTVRPLSDLEELVIEARIAFRPRLDANLAVQPIGSFAMLQSTVPEGGFARRFAMRASDPSRGGQLLPEAAREALDKSFVGTPGPIVDDGGVTWTWRSAPPWPNVDVFADAILEVARAWRAIRDAARDTPPPAGIEDAWVVLHGIELPPGVAIWGCPAGIQGERSGVAVGVSVAPYLAGTGWVVRARVDLPEPLPGTPKVLREGKFGWLDRMMAMAAGRSEIEVGDPAFDQRFAIRSGKRDELLALLDTDVRKAMLALDGVLPVELDARGIEARGRLTADRELRDTVHATLALAGFIGDARQEG
jgi:hypothetical protein